jgi:hypothetical protein
MMSVYYTSLVAAILLGTAEQIALKSAAAPDFWTAG